jgi:hypothetical protein
MIDAACAISKRIDSKPTADPLASQELKSQTAASQRSNRMIY